MHGHVLAQGVVVTDDQTHIAALELEVLGRLAKCDKGVDLAIRANFQIAVQADMGMQSRAVSDLNVRTDNAIRTDLDAFAQAGALVHDGGRVNTGGHVNSVRLRAAQTWPRRSRPRISRHSRAPRP